MKSIIKKIAATTAAMVMSMSMMGIGANARYYEKFEHYQGNYMEMSCISRIYYDSNETYSRNLTIYRNNTKRYCTAKTEVLNSSLSLIKGDQDSGALSLGDILTPNVTLNNSNAKTASFYTEVRKDTSSKSSVIENHRLNISLKIDY